MTTPRRLRFVHAQVAWMLATVLSLSLLGALSLELFFVVSLIGFLVVTELTAPFTVTPRWRARLKWFIVLGLVGFAYVVVRRILAILPPAVTDLLLPFRAWAPWLSALPLPFRAWAPWLAGVVG